MAKTPGLEQPGEPPLGFVADGVAEGRPGRTTISSTNICEKKWEADKAVLNATLKQWINSLDKWKLKKKDEIQKEFRECLDWTDSTWNLIQWGLGIVTWGACVNIAPDLPKPFVDGPITPTNPWGILPDPSEPPTGGIQTGFECSSASFCFSNTKRPLSPGQYLLDPLNNYWDSDNVPCSVSYPMFDACTEFMRMATDWLDNVCKDMLKRIREYEKAEIAKIDKELEECKKKNPQQVTP